MGANAEVEVWEAFVFKIIPLIFIIPLTLRIFPLTPDFLRPFLEFDIESFAYYFALFAMSAISFLEMGYAKTYGEKGWQGMNAGASLMGLIGVTGIILGLIVMAVGIQEALSGVFRNIIAWYMFAEVIILAVSARKEILAKKRLFSRGGYNPF